MLNLRPNVWIVIQDTLANMWEVLNGIMQKYPTGIGTLVFQKGKFMLNGQIFIQADQVTQEIFLIY